MHAITALISQPRRAKVDLYLDGELAFTIARKLARESGVFVGKNLSDQQVRELQDQEEMRAALDAAYRYLAYGSRSESEMRIRLRRKGVLPNTLEKAIARLRELRLLDDAAFAQQWVEHRATSNPRGRRLVQWELRQKGIQQVVAEESVQVMDDEEGAYKAAERRAARSRAQNYPEFRKRLGDFLVRRGFGYAVAERTVARLWKERQGEEAAANARSDV